MKVKVDSVLLRERSRAGDYSCADGEIESMEGLVAERPSEGSGDACVPPESPESRKYRLHTPPAPEVRFSLARRALPGWQGTPDMLPSAIVDAKENTPEGWGKEASRFVGDLTEDARRHGLFVEPFFVLAALRLADGSHVAPTAPVLMIPNSEAPVVAAGTTDLSVARMTLRAVAAVCGLRCRIMNAAGISAWRGKVTHVDIFVSDPVSLYDGGREFVGFHRLEASAFSHSVDPAGCNRESRVSTDIFDMAWKPSALSDTLVGKRLAATGGAYRLVREVAVGGFSTETAGEAVAVEDIGCEGEEEGVYVPDYALSQGVEAAGKAEFSGRTTLYDLTVTVPAVPPLSSLAPVHEGVMADKDRVAVEVVISRGGEILRSVCSAGEKLEIGEGCFPRWIFFPDPDAVKMTISTASGTYAVPLRRHPSLRGAYWWCGGFGKIAFEDMGVGVSGSVLMPGSPVVVERDSCRMPGAVWRSLKGNSIAYPDGLLMNLDVSRVIFICRAFRSSGLVATTSPTAYLFTSEGVYLLKEMEDGTLRDAGLICDYVLSDASAVRREGRMLEFVEEGGDTVRIEGTSVKTLSGNGGTPGSSSLSSAGRPVVVCGEGDGVDGYFVTRPVKLGDGERLKRIFALEPRGTCAASRLTLEVYGSVDLRSWRLLARRRGRIGGLWGPRIRFVKIRVEGRLTSADTVEALVVRSCT